MLRRSFLRTAAGILVAPAIVRTESIMRVRPLAPGGLVPGSLTYLAGEGGPDFELVGRRLPAGLELHRQTGVIAGAPRQAEAVRFTIRAAALGGIIPGDRVSILFGGREDAFEVREIRAVDRRHAR